MLKTELFDVLDAAAAWCDCTLTGTGLTGVLLLLVGLMTGVECLDVDDDIDDAPDEGLIISSIRNGELWFLWFEFRGTGETSVFLDDELLFWGFEFW